MTGLSLADVNVGRLPIYRPEPDDTVLVTGGSSPAIFVHGQEDQRSLVVAFAPGQSDFPLRAAFPLFIAQALHWLAPPPEATVTWGWPVQESEMASSITSTPEPPTLAQSPALPSWPLLAGAAALLSFALAVSLSRVVAPADRKPAPR
jgi:hypothetical protein